MCNLTAALAAAGLFYFVLAALPRMRHDSEIDRSAMVRADVARNEALFADAKAKMASRDWGVAAALTRQLLDSDPDNPIYLLQLAGALREQNRAVDEATTWERYILVSPTPWFACPDVARAWGRAGNAERALASFERCYQLAPQNSDVIFFLGREYEKQRRWKEAKSLYGKGLDLSPDYVDLKLGLGRILLVEGKADQTEVVALEVVASQPANTDGLLLLGSACRELGKLAEARVALAAGLAIAPHYSDFQYMLGRVAEDEGNREEALRWYREALSITPDRDDAKERLALLGEGGK